MAFDIQKGVPIPKLKRTKPPVFRKYKFDEMAVGDFFFVPNRIKNTMGTHTASVGKKLGMKFTTRMIYMHESLEGWVECEGQVDGSVLGVGVWRVE